MPQQPKPIGSIDGASGSTQPEARRREVGRSVNVILPPRVASIEREATCFPLPLGELRSHPVVSSNGRVVGLLRQLLPPI